MNDQPAQVGSQVTQEKWGAVVAKAGFTIVPNHLVAYNQFVPDDEKLSATELYVLLQILLHWWGDAQMPFPSKTTLAVRTGLSPRQVQRVLGSLEEKELIRRVARFGDNNSGRMSNAFDLEPLVSKLKMLARQYPTLRDRPAEKTKAPAVRPGL